MQYTTPLNLGHTPTPGIPIDSAGLVQDCIVMFCMPKFVMHCDDVWVLAKWETTGRTYKTLAICSVGAVWTFIQWQTVLVTSRYPTQHWRQSPCTYTIDKYRRT